MKSTAKAKSSILPPNQSSNIQISSHTSSMHFNSPSMEDPAMPNPNLGSSVDTSRPFSSVKEAVAVFGERLLVGEAYSSSPKPCAHVTFPEPGGSRDQSMPSFTTEVKEEKEVLDSLKKLEAELEETKQELRLLKEREEDTEVALASLNAELHKNMSKLAEAEAAEAAAAKAVATRRITMGSENGRVGEEMKKSMSNGKESPSLAQILSFGDNIAYFGGKREKKKIKKKPIIPLVGDLLFRKKGSLLSSFNSFK